MTYAWHDSHDLSIHKHAHGSDLVFGDILFLCIYYIISISQDGRTPLMVASIEGHVDIVRMLIDADAQVNKQDEV